ncbi:MAG: hypothetical protein LBU33_02960 [Endomicrobium sp.]|jgi:hypothetical protein|nr:hypothetical protein [Endomicrobium sp.]
MAVIGLATAIARTEIIDGIISPLIQSFKDKKDRAQNVIGVLICVLCFFGCSYFARGTEGEKNGSNKNFRTFVMRHAGHGCTAVAPCFAVLSCAEIFDKRVQKMRPVDELLMIIDCLFDNLI